MAESSMEIFTLVKCNEKLVIALSGDPLGVANALLPSGFIRERTLDQMQLQSKTPKEKATVLVADIKATVQLTPQRFHEFIDILNASPSNSDIVKILKTTYASKPPGASRSAIIPGPSQLSQGTMN